MCGDGQRHSARAETAADDLVTIFSVGMRGPKHRAEPIQDAAACRRSVWRAPVHVKRSLKKPSHAQLVHMMFGVACHDRARETHLLSTPAMAASVGTIAHALHARRGLALHLLDTQKPKIPIPTICQYLSGPGAQRRKSMLMWHPDKWSRVSERVDDPSLLMELTQHAQAMTRSSVKVLAAARDTERSGSEDVRSTGASF